VAVEVAPRRDPARLPSHTGRQLHDQVGTRHSPFSYSYFGGRPCRRGLSVALVTTRRGATLGVRERPNISAVTPSAIMRPNSRIPLRASGINVEDRLDPIRDRQRDNRQVLRTHSKAARNPQTRTAAPTMCERTTFSNKRDRREWCRLARMSGSRTRSWLRYQRSVKRA
jgi:hypothetical protein